jgi:hypothetical protein
MTVARRSADQTKVWDSIDQLDASRRAEPLLPLGIPRRVATSRVFATPGETIVCDTTNGPASVFLPEPDRSVPLGTLVTVVNTGNQAVTVIAPSRMTIKGDRTKVVSRDLSPFIFLYATKDQWIPFGLSSVTSTAPTGQPWFEWDGSSTAQFDTLINGSAVSSSTATVVTVAGVSWIEIAVTTSGGVSIADRAAILPISQSPPSADYLVTAEVANLGDYGGPFVVARYASHSSSYYTAVDKWTGSWIKQTGKLTASEGNTNLLTCTGGSIGWDASANAGMTIGVGVQGSTLLKNVHDFDAHALDLSSPVTAKGQAGIGVTTIWGLTSAFTMRFRNIRCYAIN